MKALLLDWVRGQDLQDLADDYLSSVPDEGYRYEQLAEFSASVFEHHLPWTLSLIIDWVNRSLESAGVAYRIPDQLPGAIHYGVNTKVALQLMATGVRSRRLANRIAAQAETRPEGSSVREWLAEQSMTEWRANFDASPTELADLLSYSRRPGRQSISRLLDGETLQFEIAGDPDLTTVSAHAELVPDTAALEPAPIRVLTPSGSVGVISPSDHEDIALIISMGVPLEVSVVPAPTELVVTISLAQELDLAG